MRTTRKAFRKAVYGALLLSVLGLAVVCLLIAGPARTMEWTASASLQIAVGYAAMILSIELAGIRLRSKLTRRWAGALFALLLFIVGVLAGSATSMVLYRDFEAYSYIVKPLFWMGIYGFIPAAMIGCIGSSLLRWTNNRRLTDFDRNLSGNKPG